MTETIKKVRQPSESHTRGATRQRLKARLLIAVNPRQRRKRRELLAAHIASGREFWYAASITRQHLALTVVSSTSLCLKGVYETSNIPIRTLNGIACFSCNHLATQARKDNE